MICKNSGKLTVMIIYDIQRILFWEMNKRRDEKKRKKNIDEDKYRRMFTEIQQDKKK